MVNLKDPKTLSLAGVITAITLVLGFTQWGFIPLPTPAGAATIMHIPTIIAGLVLGPLFGAIVGFLFGVITVFFFSHIAPFWVLIPARPFIGIVAGVVFYLLFRLFGKSERVKFYSTFIFSLFVFILLLWLGVKYFQSITYWWAGISYILALSLFLLLKDKNPEILSLSIASFLGSMTNTVGTLGLAVIFKIFPIETAVSVGIIHGIPEAILAVIVCTPTAIALRRYLGKGDKS
ncbi:MAG: ECF transporter S component [Dictyoglomaceae bacterium]